MYKLYGALGGASLAPHCVLEKGGLPYEFIEVNIARDVERDPEYLELNPHGRIPTLVFDDQVIIESAAICIYLADKHSHTQLSPPLDHPDRASYIQWMVYATNTLQETMVLKLYTHKHTDDPGCSDQVASRASSKLDMIISFIEKSLGRTEGPFFLESGLSTADIYLHMLTAWDPSIRDRIVSSSSTSSIPADKRLTNIQRSYQAMLKQPDIAKTFATNGHKITAVTA